MSVGNGPLIGVAASLLTISCAAQSQRPTEEMTRARTLIEQAERDGAQRYAGADLEHARDKLRHADEAAEHGNQVVARQRATEAVADAELASARAASGDAQHAADEVLKSTETLRQEAARDPNATGSSQP